MPKVIDVLSKGDIAFYSCFGEGRRVMVTKVDAHLGEFDGLMGEAQVWGRATQVTAIRARDGKSYSCYNGVAIPE